MKILITGGAGFIGSHIADALLEKGHEVHIADDLSTGKKENIPAKAIFHQVDICEEKIHEILEKEKFEVIYHEAAQLDVRKSVADPIFNAKINILGTLQLLETGIKNGLKKFIFASSGGTVYGEPQYYPADEAHPIKPISPYGIAKASVEMYLYFYHLSYGLEHVSLRLCECVWAAPEPARRSGRSGYFCR